MKKYKVTTQRKDNLQTLDAVFFNAENKSQAIKYTKQRLNVYGYFVSHFNFKAFDVTEKDTLTIGYVNEFGN